MRDAKAGPRMVPLTRPLVAVLDGIARAPGSPWVVVGKRRNGRLTNLDPYWQPIRAKAGLEDVRIHDLRHSYASRALALGSLRWEDVALDANELRLPDAKTGARIVPLSPSAVKLLAGLPRVPGNPWVIPGRKPGTHLRDLDDAWKILRARRPGRRSHS